MSKLSNISSDIVEEIEYTAPSKVSRYKKVKGFKSRTNIYLDLPTYVDIPVHEDDSYFIVFGKYIDRIDLIAHKFYNDSKMWWVIAEANSLEDPMDIPINTVLRIPAFATLYGVGGVIGNG